MKKGFSYIDFINFILITLFFIPNLFGEDIELEKSKIIPDLIRPRYMDIDNKRIYIVENRVKIKGFSTETFEKNFEISTRRGQGPGEFPWAPAIIVSDKNIFVKTTTKIAKYTKKGRYINEHKLKGKGIIYPFGKNYVFWYFHFDKKTKKRYIIVDLINSKNKRLKRVFTFKQKRFSPPSMITKNGKGKVFLLGSERVSITVSENKIFVLEPEKIIKLEIFDLNGELIKTIGKIDIPKIKITPEGKLELMENWKYIEGFSGNKWEEFKKRYEFLHPQFFPRFKEIIVDQDNIYIKTYKSKKRMKEFLVYDFNGKLKKNIFLPESKIWKIKDGKYYYLSFSDEEEEWLLYRINIKL